MTGAALNGNAPEAEVLAEGFKVCYSLFDEPSLEGSGYTMVCAGIMAFCGHCLILARQARVMASILAGTP